MPELDLAAFAAAPSSTAPGCPPFTADVGVRDGRIAAVGRRRRAPRRRTIDADGCVVAPGFVDIHTHYDAQLHFEPTASPSSWHGVTTVINGNCGFSLFPARPADVPGCARCSAAVEGMSADTLAAGVTFRAAGCADFAAGLDGTLGVNAAFQVGHSARAPLRHGRRRRRRAPRPPTRSRRCRRCSSTRCDDGRGRLLVEQLEMHVDQHGQPVPSNLAAPEELVALASVFARRPHGRRSSSSVARTSRGTTTPTAS